MRLTIGLLIKPNDKIFVYEDILYKNSLTYRVEGEVNKAEPTL